MPLTKSGLSGVIPGVVKRRPGIYLSFPRRRESFLSYLNNPFAITVNGTIGNNPAPNNELITKGLENDN